MQCGYKFKTKEHSLLINTHVGVHNDLEDAIDKARSVASSVDGYEAYSFVEVHTHSMSITKVFEKVKEIAPEGEEEKKVVQEIKGAKNFDDLIQQL